MANQIRVQQCVGQIEYAPTYREQVFQVVGQIEYGSNYRIRVAQVIGQIEYALAAEPATSIPMIFVIT